MYLVALPWATFIMSRKEEILNKMSKVIKKKILTEDDLLKFCQEQKFAKFSSKDTGYQLALKVPTTFEVDNTVDDNHRGMMKLKFRIFHTGLNRNKSYVSKESAEKAMKTIADRPVLAAIHQLDDGTWDFEGHEMEIVKDDKGNEELRYIESQVGSFSSEPAFWEHDESLDKDYVCAYAYISEEYTRACEIIRSKQGSKNSCELFIDELSYNAKEKYLELNDFYVNASTLLGSRDDGTEIQEGMEGSRADIADFSVKNNSVKFDKDEKLIELLENLNKTLSNFNKEQNLVQTLSKEGGNDKNMDKFNELLEKYGKTADDIDFEYEDMTDEELESKFEEVFGKLEENSTSEPSNDEGTDNGDESEENPEVKEDNACGGGSSGSKKKKKNSVENEPMTRTYEISHDDIRYALYNLLTSYKESDNDLYYITGVYDSYFVYENWNGGKIYGQKYTKDNDNVAFDGERYTLHKEYLTDSEYTELQSMRSNYSSIIAELETYKEKELDEKKEELFNSKDYNGIRDTKEFSELKKNSKDYSIDDLTDKLDKIISNSVKNGTFSFSANVHEKKTPVHVNFAQKLADEKPKKNSFLDGLLNC